MKRSPSWLEAAPPSEIEAGAARLRRWRLDDAAVLARLVTANLEHLRPWMEWAQEAPSLEEQRAFLLRMQAAWEQRTDFGFAVTLRGTAELVGGMGLHTRRGPGTLEIGYWIAAARTGRGYATTGARALTDRRSRCPAWSGSRSGVTRPTGRRRRSRAGWGSRWKRSSTARLPRPRRRAWA